MAVSQPNAYMHFEDMEVTVNGYPVMVKHIDFTREMASAALTGRVEFVVYENVLEKKNLAVKKAVCPVCDKSTDYPAGSLCAACTVALRAFREEMMLKEIRSLVGTAETFSDAEVFGGS